MREQQIELIATLNAAAKVVDKEDKIRESIGAPLVQNMGEYTRWPTLGELRQDPIQPIEERMEALRELRRGLEFLKSSRKLHEEIRASRGGRLLPPSWPLIRQAREERSRQIYRASRGEG